MTKPRYLTKSRFKLALDCPTKLFYTRKKEYEDSSETDTFLEALAQGGFQVEELARMEYPDALPFLARIGIIKNLQTKQVNYYSIRMS